MVGAERAVSSVPEEVRILTGTPLAEVNLGTATRDSGFCLEMPEEAGAEWPAAAAGEAAEARTVSVEEEEEGDGEADDDCGGAPAAHRQGPWPCPP